MRVRLTIMVGVRDIDPAELLQLQQQGIVAEVLPDESTPVDQPLPVDLPVEQPPSGGNADANEGN
jgi:hypothetical protein